MLLWLDDVRASPNGWVWVKTAAEAIAALKNGDVEQCSLDHDLGHLRGGGYVGAMEPSGLAVIDWMIRTNVWPQRIYIHSANPVGAERMLAAAKLHAPSDVVVMRIPVPYEDRIA
jgi:hypothetical protein